MPIFAYKLMQKKIKLQAYKTKGEKGLFDE